MRELTFYLTGNRDRKFQKLIFSVSIDDLEDGHDWIDENIDRIEPPRFVIPKDASKKVKGIIKDYCLDNGCDFPEGINFV